MQKTPRIVSPSEGGTAGEVAGSVCLEKCIQRGEIFFGMGECGLEVLAVEFPEGDERGGGQGLEQAAGADGVFRGVDQQHGDGESWGEDGEQQYMRRRWIFSNCVFENFKIPADFIFLQKIEKI